MQNMLSRCNTHAFLSMCAQAAISAYCRVRSPLPDEAKDMSLIVGTFICNRSYDTNVDNKENVLEIAEE